MATSHATPWAEDTVLAVVDAVVSIVVCGFFVLHADQANRLEQFLFLHSERNIHISRGGRQSHFVAAHVNQGSVP